MGLGLGIWALPCFAALPAALGRLLAGSGEKWQVQWVATVVGVMSDETKKECMREVGAWGT